MTGRWWRDVPPGALRGPLRGASWGQEWRSLYRAADTTCFDLDLVLDRRISDESQWPMVMAVTYQDVIISQLGQRHLDDSILLGLGVAVSMSAILLWAEYNWDPVQVRSTMRLFERSSRAFASMTSVGMSTPSFLATLTLVSISRKCGVKPSAKTKQS